jgi:hypothetical protein
LVALARPATAAAAVAAVTAACEGEGGEDEQEEGESWFHDARVRKIEVWLGWVDGSVYIREGGR